MPHQGCGFSKVDTKPMRIPASTALLALLAATLAQPALAQTDDWSFLVQPYLMLPSMDGKAAVAGFDANVDVGARNIVENLNFGFLGYVEAAKGDLALGVDVNYMNLDANPDDALVSANVSQTAIQPMLFYRVTSYFELMGGIRYNSIKLSLASDIAAIDGRESKKDWVDPIVGFRFNGPISNSTSFGLIANAGGFGIGSAIAIQVRPMLSFKVGKGITIDAGYQFFYMDYETGADRNRFAYDVLTTGPILGLSFRF